MMIRGEGAQAWLVSTVQEANMGSTMRNITSLDPPDEATVFISLVLRIGLS